MNEPSDARVEAIWDLIDIRRPVFDAVAALGSFEWDAPRELVVLTRGHVTAAIQRCLDGTISLEELRAWAEALEGRDDVGFEEGGVDMREAVFELATPELFGEPTTTISELLERLRQD